MFKFAFISTLCLLSSSTGVAADNNMFIYSSPTSTRAVAPAPISVAVSDPFVAPAPVPAPRDEDTASQFTNFHDYDFWQIGQEEHHDDNARAGSDSDSNSSQDGDIVTAQVPSARAPEPRSPPQVVVPDNVPMPEPRPLRTPPAPVDIPNCRYGRNCWKGKGLSQQIQKIVANVEYINSLHKAQLDPRYLVCTGWRESTFNPGAVGAAGERGMFQVMAGTGRAALGYGPKVLPKANYMTKMVNSTLAQTELSYLTLKMKVAEGASARTLNGSGSVQDYRNLARRYNGAGPRAHRYAAAIADCFDCMRKSFPNIKGSTPVNESKARQCLAKAKANH